MRVLQPFKMASKSTRKKERNKIEFRNWNAFPSPLSFGSAFVPIQAATSSLIKSTASQEIASLPWLNSFRKTFLLDLNKKFGKETAIADKVEFWLICNWHLKYVSEKNTNNIFGIKLPLKMQCRKLRQL